MGFFCQCKMQKLSLRFKLHANREQDNVNEEKGVDCLFEKLNWFTCFTTSVWTQTKVFSGSKEQQNNNIIILLCKKPEFMLRQVCGPDSKQTTFKMLTPWTEFGLIRAMPCWGMAAELTRQSDFFTHFPSRQLLICPVSVQVELQSDSSECLHMATNQW